MKMSSELERRTAIIVALRCGRAPKEIIDFFKFPKATVYSIAKSFKESEDIEEGFLTPERKTHAQFGAKLVLRESRHVLVKGVLAPQRSPDLNPCDYYLWGVLERTLKACSQHCGLLESCHHPGSGQLVQGTGGSCCWEVQAPCGGCYCERRKLD
ncbi:Uncharacterized protein FKW44_002246 [Caligus rogercresseyi]|uniref:Uncharacterized protein n=1 Tax=Caligus rogercresseyi TaxID=217165 RepID=A0A7T8KJX9_CALRO|nr:Uncharacterized protein FKW44_002246 [Caligus rogercresseyi]